MLRAAAFAVSVGAAVAVLRARRVARRAREDDHGHDQSQLLQGFSKPKWIKFQIKVANETERAHGVMHVVRELCPGWEALTDSQLEIVVLQGGITNQLYMVKQADGSDAVLVRIYGKNTEVLIDREEEQIVFHILSEKGFGPRLYGLFENGRVEGFIPSVGVTPPEMGKRDDTVDYPKLVATELARMHYLDMPLPRKPHLWGFLRKFERLTQGISLKDNAEEQARLDALQLTRVRRRLERLESELPSAQNAYGRVFIEAAQSEGEKLAMDFLFESVFCHNDLLAGNMLYVPEEQRMQFIDFEYGKYNFRGFDIANHFCEYAGFDFDLPRWYPKKETQKHFLQSYVAAIKKSGEGPFAGLADQLEADPTLAKDFYKHCVAWIDKFAIASHFLWGLWSLIQKLYSPIEFDYLDYSRLRLGAISLDGC